ncbi:MAG: NADH:flavin oxidoreductase/NADH oxidase [Burkholderiales bacterium]|nr:NADH:flavin oxidoreductase/NADH oxidase [Burkholderiales bacterium]
MTSALFLPIRLRDLELPNRIVVSPMCQYSAVDGSATAWHLVHLGQFAIGGAGLVIIEATHVEPRGRITHGCLGLWSDANEAALVPVVDFFRAHGGAKLGMQLSHSGRKGSARLPWQGRGEPLSSAEGSWPTVAASPLAYDDGWPLPQALDAAGLAEVREAHAQAAMRAARLGIDLLELHIAHGYLLHGFLSPLSNTRTDAYGGGLDGRLRYPLEVFRAVRAAWPQERPLGVRVSATDWVDGGWTLDETCVFARLLADAGCDYLTVSSGGLSPRQRIPIGEGHQLPLAAEVRRASGLPVMGVGMLFDPRHVEQAITGGACDMAALARGMLHDPHWAWHAAAALGADVGYPPQYIRGYRSAWLRAQRGVSAQ